MGKIKLFTVAGIPVYMDYSLALILILLSLSISSGYLTVEMPDAPPVLRFFTGIFTALALFAGVLLHELGHSLTAQRMGIPIRDITLFLFGGAARMADEPKTPEDLFKIAISGPLVSLFIAFFSGSLYLLVRGMALPGGLPSVLKYLAVVNMVIALFNLAPGLPLDGGRVLMASIWALGGNYIRAARYSSWTGRFVGAFFLLTGLFLMFRGISVNGLWLGFIGLFLIRSAGASFEQMQLAEAFRGLTAANAMEYPTVKLEKHITLRELSDKYFSLHPHRFYGVSGEPKEDGESDLLGFIALEDLLTTPEEDWSVETAGALAEKSAKIRPRLDENEKITAVLEIFSDLKVPLIIVTKEGRLRGVITRESVSNLAVNRLTFLN